MCASASGGPIVGWVALGWGEPCVPWWGPPGFRHRPWWGGWRGPRVVNNVVVNNTTVVNVKDIHVYRNTTVRNAVVAVKMNHFGRGPIKSGRISGLDQAHLQPIYTPPETVATPASLVPRENRGVRPSNKILERPVVATRQPRTWAESASGGERRVGPVGVHMPAPRLVSVPRRHEPATGLNRAPFGQSRVERRLPGRAQPPPHPGVAGSRGGERAAKGGPPVVRQAQAPQPQAPRPSAPGGAGSHRPERAGKAAPPVTREAWPQHGPQAAAPAAAMPQPQIRHSKAPPALPGQPADRLAPRTAPR